MANADIDLISRVLHHPDEMPEVMALSITPDHFRDAEMRAAFEFILKHRKKHGAVPSAKTVEEEVGFKPTVAPAETSGFYAERLIDRQTFFVAKDGVNEIAEFLNDHDVESATSRVQLLAHDVRLAQASKTEIAYIEEVDPRIERYDVVSGVGGVTGIPMPWAEFTEHTMGWQNGEFNVIAARTGVGKTFMGLLFAHTAWMEGKKCLTVSMEMPTGDMHLRHDAMVAEVPADGLYRGTLTPAQEKKYRDTMEELRDIGGFDIIGHNMSASMGQIEAAIELLEPEYLFIDGLYLVKPTDFSPRMSRTERANACADEVKQVAARYDIPVVGALQLNREQKKGAKDSDTANIYGSDAWGQNAANVFSLIQTREDRNDEVMRCSLIKGRNCPPFASRIQWDLDDTMEFDLLEFETGVTSIKPKKTAAGGGAVTW